MSRQEQFGVTIRIKLPQNDQFKNSSTRVK
jgi:hypothetical protein